MTKWRWQMQRGNSAEWLLKNHRYLAHTALFLLLIAAFALRSEQETLSRGESPSLWYGRLRGLLGPLARNISDFFALTIDGSGLIFFLTVLFLAILLRVFVVIALHVAISRSETSALSAVISPLAPRSWLFAVSAQLALAFLVVVGTVMALQVPLIGRLLHVPLTKLGTVACTLIAHLLAGAFADTLKKLLVLLHFRVTTK